MNDTPPPLEHGSPAPADPGSNPAPTTPPSTGGGGKWLLGCGLGCLGVVVVGVILVFVILNFSKNKINEWVLGYTSSQPVQIEAPQLQQGEIDSAVTRFDSFSSALEAGTASESLILSEDDINALLFHHPDFADAAGMTNVSIENDQLTSRVSIDLNSIEIPIDFVADAVRDKYFNGEVTLSIDMRAQRPALFIEELSVAGRPLPQELMEAFRSENLLKEAQSDPELKKFFDKISEIKIENNQLIVVPATP
ncbi:MAG: hypothetical protein AAGC68_00415 [Verrucomicrobiota bacterium]